MLHQVVATEQPGHGRHVGLHQAIAQRAASVDLFQVRLAHHAPAVGRPRQLERYALADHRHVAVVRVARVSHEQIGTTSDGFPYPRVQFARGGVGEAQFQLGMALDLHGGPGRVHTTFEIFAVGKSAVLEARARQGCARLDGRVETRLRHEQVVVARLGENMPGLALDQVAQNIVGYPTAQAANDFTASLHRLVEHQRHFVVEA
ncbi:hypothetical protein D3C81_1220630 [compost metagenome]